MKNLIKQGRLPWPQLYSEEFWKMARKLGFFLIVAKADPEPLKQEEMEHFLQETDSILGGVNHAIEDIIVVTRNRVADMKNSIESMEDKDHENLFLNELTELRKKNQELESHTKQFEERLKKQSALIKDLKDQIRLDPLTGVLNRRAMEPDLKKEMERAKRYRFPLSVIMCDIDHFKKINDTYGHKIGDRVLQKLAFNLKGSIRTSDNIYRYGGEEFLVLLPHTGCHEAAELAERLRQMVESYKFISPKHNLNLSVTMSFGVTEMREKDESPCVLVARSDAALYRAKLAGRNRVETIYDRVPA